MTRAAILAHLAGLQFGWPDRRLWSHRWFVRQCQAFPDYTAVAEGALRTKGNVREDERGQGNAREDESGPADPVDAFNRGARVGNKVSTGEGLLPVDLLEKGDDVAYLVDSSLTGRVAKLPPLLRENAESSCTRDLEI